MAYKTKKEREAEVSFKILNGALLSPEEFETAKKAGFYTCPMDTPYEAFKRTHYEDDKVRGYLCIKDGKIQSRVLDKEDGKTSYCIWGVHREDIDPEKLREDQKELW